MEVSQMFQLKLFQPKKIDNEKGYFLVIKKSCNKKNVPTM